MHFSTRKPTWWHSLKCMLWCWDCLVNWSSALEGNRNTLVLIVSIRNLKFWHIDQNALLRSRRNQLSTHKTFTAQRKCLMSIMCLWWAVKSHNHTTAALTQCLDLNIITHCTIIWPNNTLINTEEKTCWMIPALL